MAKNTHTTYRNNDLFCTHCGQNEVLRYPMFASEFSSVIDAFNAKHEKCEKTWAEPMVDQSLAIGDRAIWWINKGDTGLSSKAIWTVMMGINPSSADNRNHPHDPDDFKRCYKLLQTIPEWKSEMFKLKSLSPTWSNLVDNWDKLTAMYEVKDEGMYEFMKSLRA